MDTGKRSIDLSDTGSWRRTANTTKTKKKDKPTILVEEVSKKQEKKSEISADVDAIPPRKSLDKGLLGFFSGTKETRAPSPFLTTQKEKDKKKESFISGLFTARPSSTPPIVDKKPIEKVKVSQKKTTTSAAPVAAVVKQSVSSVARHDVADTKTLEQKTKKERPKTQQLSAFKDQPIAKENPTIKEQPIIKEQSKTNEQPILKEQISLSELTTRRASKSIPSGSKDVPAPVLSLKSVVSSPEVAKDKEINSRELFTSQSEKTHEIEEIELPKTPRPRSYSTGSTASHASFDSRVESAHSTHSNHSNHDEEDIKESNSPRAPIASLRSSQIMSLSLRSSMEALKKKIIIPGYKDEPRYQRTLEGYFIHKLVDQSTTWHSVHIPTRQEECSQNLKFLIRKGIPDSFRNRVWKTTTGALKFAEENPKFYKFALDRSFGERIPENVGKIPLFGGQFQPENHYLTNEGILKARRILCVFALDNPEIEYFPMIHDLVCILLHFMSEADCYITLHLMMKANNASSERRYFMPNKKGISLFLHTFDDLIKKRDAKIFAHMKALNTNSHYFADDWFLRLFVTIFPYQTVLRVFDAFLNEGGKILYRVALAFMKKMKPELLKCRFADEFHRTLNDSAHDWKDADALMNKAFTLRMKRKYMKKYDQKNRHKVLTVQEPKMPIYYRPKISQDSQIISELQFEILWSWLPHRYCTRDPELVFRASKDGYSLSNFFKNVGDYSPTILIVKTTENEVFGAFVSHPWMKNKSFYGDRNCFLWRFTPQPEMFGWDEGSTDYFMLVSNKDIQVGGGDGVGLWIDDELHHGRTQKCSSFDNEPLTTDGRENFRCVGLEVYRLCE